MKKHDFDPLSFVIGALFAGVGLLVMVGAIGGDDLVDADVWPLFVIGAGLAFLAPALARRNRGEAPTEPEEHHEEEEPASAV